MLRFNTPITPMTTAVTEIVELHLHYLSALLHSQRYSCVDLTNAVHVASMNVLLFVFCYKPISPQNGVETGWA